MENSLNNKILRDHQRSLEAFDTEEKLIMVECATNVLKHLKRENREQNIQIVQAMIENLKSQTMGFGGNRLDLDTYSG
ncbi:MAG: hypothetical protein OEY56_14555 [Cyclobacteriaceae bacterium]|nr:hypothetical protein [Cyclobacteriaceae bacterium]